VSDRKRRLFRKLIVAISIGFTMLVLTGCTERPVPRAGGGGEEVAEGSGTSSPEVSESTEAAPAKEEKPESMAGEADTGSGSGGSGGGAGEAVTVSGNEVRIELKDFEFVPKDVVVKAGDITFIWDNTSTHAHNYRILRADNPKDIIYPGPKVGAKKKQTKTLKLEPGDYIVICNLSDHEKRGMKGTLKVVP